MAAVTRRNAIALAAGLLSADLGGQAFAQGAGSDRLVLLGVRGGPLVTGYSPTPSASVIVFQGVPYVVDAGYGVTLKLLAAGVPLAAIRNVFITHHHSDHNLELGNLAYNAWLAGLRTQVDVYGPSGVDALMSAFWESNRFDVETRIADEGRPDPRLLVAAHAYAEGPVMTSGEVRVSALRNNHPPVTESFALRFDLGPKAIVFSGDTTYLPAMVAFAANADYLVHEVMYPPAIDAMVARRPNAARLRDSILSHHTRPEEVGRIATAAKVKTLVLNHLIPSDDPAVTRDVWLKAVQPHFGGRIVVGEDLIALNL
jgi:ribonuclease BN (tRNA processing enzyme)